MLTTIVLALFLVGLAFAAVPFFSALKPNARAFAELPRFPIPDLEPNSFTYLPHPTEAPWGTQRWGAKILVVRRNGSQRDYWYIPTIDGTPTVPDYYPWRAGWKCKDLSPDFQTNVIRCKDTQNGKSVFDDVSWDLDGKDLGNLYWLPDLMRIEGKEVNGDFVPLHPGDA